MRWAELTDVTGKTIYVNLNHVISVEEYGWIRGGVIPETGSALLTNLPDENGRPRTIYVQDAPEVVYAWSSVPATWNSGSSKYG